MTRWCNLKNCPIGAALLGLLISGCSQETASSDAPSGSESTSPSAIATVAGKTDSLGADASDAATGILAGTIPDTDTGLIPSGKPNDNLFAVEPIESPADPSGAGTTKAVEQQSVDPIGDLLGTPSPVETAPPSLPSLEPSGVAATPSLPELPAAGGNLAPITPVATSPELTDDAGGRFSDPPAGGATDDRFGAPLPLDTTPLVENARDGGEAITPIQPDGALPPVNGGATTPMLEEPTNPATEIDVFDDTFEATQPATELPLDPSAPALEPPAELAPPRLADDLLPQTSPEPALPEQPPTVDTDLEQALPPASAAPFGLPIEQSAPKTTDLEPLGSPFGSPLASSPEESEDEPASLGVRVVSVSPQAKRRWGISVGDGAVIHSLHGGSPADDAAFPVGGVITQIDEVEINTPQGLVEFLKSHRAGDDVVVVIQHANRTVKKNVTLAKPADAFSDGSQPGSAASPEEPGSSPRRNQGSALDQLESLFGDTGSSKSSEVEQAEFRARDELPTTSEPSELQRKVLQLEVELNEMRQRVLKLEAALRSS